jgi:putative Holliday junction resolvase
MRVLAIDPGERRMGIALSDELGMLARPAGFLDAEPLEEFMGSLKRTVAENGVGLVVVGMPRNMDGSYGPAATKARELIDALRDVLSVSVKPWDERLTTVQAHRFLRESGRSSRDRKGRVDAAAAAVLLQSYLDAQSASDNL